MVVVERGGEGLVRVERRRERRDDEAEEERHQRLHLSRRGSVGVGGCGGGWVGWWVGVRNKPKRQRRPGSADRGSTSWQRAGISESMQKSRKISVGVISIGGGGAQNWRDQNGLALGDDSLRGGGLSQCPVIISRPVSWAMASGRGASSSKSTRWLELVQGERWGEAAGK